MPSPRQQTLRPSHPQILQRLNRPPAERRREYRYRFAQALVFGIPVMALQWFGGRLGGSAEESRRWVGLLQALLGGWVTYVAAAGMLVEALILRRLTLDAAIASAAIAMTLYSIISVLGIFFTGQPFYGPLLFHLSVVLLIVYCGVRYATTADSRNETGL
jgi:cation transport ATPase